jgi:FHS family L-fucose permease-like MFS transporter
MNSQGHLFQRVRRELQRSLNGYLQADEMQRYEIVLLALFVIASGITVLQVAANPLAAALGDSERSHFRLNLSQAFNSLGTVVGPYLGSILMLRGGVFTANAAGNRAASLHNIEISFLLLALLAGLIALLVLFMWHFEPRLARVAPPPLRTADSVLTTFRSRWAVIGAAAIFLYVGAEVSIGSIMISFLHQPDVLGVSLERAGKLLSLYWLGAIIGRFGGSALMTRLSATRMLTTAALTATALCLTVNHGLSKKLRYHASIFGSVR